MKNSVENYIKSLDENKNLIDNKTDTDMEYHRKYEIIISLAEILTESMMSRQTR